MRSTFTIAKKDIKNSFSSPLVFALCSVFILLCAFFFFTLLKQYNLDVKAYLHQSPNLNQWVAKPYYRTIEVILIFILPILAMKTFADEKEFGTLELLFSSKASNLEIILAKYFSLCFLTFILLLVSFIYPLILILYSDPEVLPIFVGFLSLSLYAFSILSISLLASVLIKNPIVSAVGSIVIILILYMLKTVNYGVLTEFFKFFSIASHLELGVKGVITGVDLVYFLSLIAICLFVSNIRLGSWQE